MPTKEKPRKARPRRVRVAALRFAIQTSDSHDQATAYRELFKLLASLDYAIKYQGDRRLLLAATRDYPEEPLLLIGDLDRFTDVSAFNWYNREKRREATASERKEIRVPTAMRANYRQFQVIFDTDSHHLIYPAYESSETLSARHVLFVFRGLLEHPRVIKRFGSVTVSIEQKPSGLDRIIKSPTLRYISIEVNRPNSSFGRLDSQFKEKMLAIQAKKFREEYVADDSHSLKLDENTIETARTALGNGVVVGKITEEGITKTISTEQFPVTETVKYSPDTETLLNAIKRAARKLIASIANLT